MTERAVTPAAEHGITDEDIERIQSFLRKGRHARSVDDLRPQRADD